MGQICGRAVMLAAGLALTLMSAPASSQDIELQLNYGVYAKGFKGLSVEVAVSIQDSGYSAQLEAETAGLVSWFVDWQIQAVSEGVVDGTKLSPGAYKTRNQRGDTERSVEITYGKGGPPQVVSVPSEEADDRPPVSTDMTSGTIDPISALISTLLATTQAGVCPQPTAVFDGRRRYDVTATAVDPRKFPGSGIAPFSGAARGCLLDVVKLGGFKEKESSNRDVLNSQIVVWLADVGDAEVMVPVRLEMRGRSGRTLVHLQQVRDRRGAVVFGAS